METYPILMGSSGNIILVLGVIVGFWFWWWLAGGIRR